MTATSVQAGPLPGRGHQYSWDEARAVLAGYAFELSNLRQPHPGVYGSSSSTRSRARWAYRTYDCISASPGPYLHGVDLLVANGLNGDVQARGVASILAVADEVSECVAALDERWPQLTFWEIARDTFDDPAEHSPAWWLLRAWELLMNVDDVDIATTHKTLHHKRPHLFPLLDNKTCKAYARGEAWTSIHDELTSQESAWTDLEQWFGQVASKRGGVALTRLRLHDVLLWCHVTENRTEVASGGKGLL